MGKELDRVPLRERWNPLWMQKRTRREAMLQRRRGTGAIPFPFKVLSWGLRVCGLYPSGYRNFLDVRTVPVVHFLDGWPPALDGFRILQLSDLHIDLDPALVPVVCGLVEKASFELAVITGDFWEGSLAGMEKTLLGIGSIREAMGNPPFGVYGVLGNHDTVALGTALEDLDMQILVNEARNLGSGSSLFSLAGIDDPYLYKTDNLGRAARQCPEHLPKLLLSHSPQVAPAAREAGFKLLLSGHTHGGQVCLPGGYFLIPMEGIPKNLFRGSWIVRGLRGYTTTGTGACHLPVRFNCPPEIVVHTLRTAG